MLNLPITDIGKQSRLSRWYAEFAYNRYRQAKQIIKIINIEKINRAVMTGTPEEVIELCRFIHIESCFDYACEPPADFLEQCEKYWSGRSSFCGTVERRIGNTWYTVETVCDGNEPLRQIR